MVFILLGFVYLIGFYFGVLNKLDFLKPCYLINVSLKIMTFYRIHKLIYIFYKINKKMSGRICYTVHYICIYFDAIVLVVLCHFCVISPTGHKVWKIVFFGKLLSLLFLYNCYLIHLQNNWEKPLYSTDEAKKWN